MSLLNFLPFAVTLFGALLLVKLRFFFILHPIRVGGRIAALMKNKKTRKALSLALAGTLGVGNIVGVAYGISVGGAGSIFWILVSSLFACVIKYAESLLASDFSSDGRGGMMYVIGKSFGKIGKALASIYAVACLFLSFTMGAALQSQSAVLSSRGLGISPLLVAAAFCVLVAAVTVGGAKKIESATAYIIPISTVIYIILCLAVIISNASRLPSVIRLIMSEAFNFKSAAGGVSAYLGIRAMKEGYARGLLSNEAGAGTSSMAQSRAEYVNSAEVGLLGMCEVIFDTAILCTLTGIAVLVSGVSLSGDGMSIVVSAFEKALGGAAPILIFLLIFAFAYSTVICWYYYGTECIGFLFKKENSRVFTVLFILSLLVGFRISQTVLIIASDYLLFFMSILTLLALIKNSERVVRLSEKSDLLKNRRCKSKKSDVGEQIEACCRNL